MIDYQGPTGKQYKFIKSYFFLFTLQLVNSFYACFLQCQENRPYWVKETGKTMEVLTGMRARARAR